MKTTARYENFDEPLVAAARLSEMHEKISLSDDENFNAHL